MRIELTTSDRKRFEKYVDRSGGPDACHPWTGCLDQNGYGRFKVGGRRGRTERAHRVAWVLAGNKITPEKPCVLHDCPGGDLPACCNVRHLWGGTKADNARDMALKGRGKQSKKGLPFGATPNGRGFQARAQSNGKRIYLGTYETPEEASAAALASKHRHLGDP